MVSTVCNKGRNEAQLCKTLSAVDIVIMIKPENELENNNHNGKCVVIIIILLL